MRRTLISATVPWALVALLAACGATAATQTPKAPEASGGAFPVSVTSAAGTVRIAQRPRRILCLSPSATQMLYAIGAGRQIAGVDKYSWYPADAPRTHFTGYESSAEDYLPERPDLVIEGAVLTMHDSRTRLSTQVAEEVKKFFGEKVYQTIIPRNVQLSESPSFGKPIILYDIRSSGAQAYLNLTKEVVARD